MDTKGKLLLAVFVLIFVGGAGFFAYKLVNGKKKTNQVVAQVNDQGFLFSYGDKVENIKYIEDPLSQSYGTLAAYPNATALKGKGNSLQGVINGAQVKVGGFTTADSLEKVVAYYKKQLGANVKIKEISIGGKPHKMITTKDPQSPVVIAFSQGASTTIYLTEL